MARRDEGAHWACVTDEQRSQVGRPAGLAVLIQPIQSTGRRLSRAPLFVIAGLVVLAGACTPAGTVELAQTPPIRTPSGTGRTNHPRIVDRDYVVVVSFDGFRHDYLERVDTPAFDRLAETGVTAEALVPPFPSLTFPSHYTIATGMYPAHHGIVGNQFFDPDRSDDFDYRDTDDAQDGSWWGGEPIWLTAERQGMVAAAFFFPGTEAAIDGLRPSRWRAYDGGIPNERRVDQVLQWLRLPPDERPHLITAYFSIVDGAGHRLGPDVADLDRSIRTADRLLGSLMSEIDRLRYGDRVYLVVLSDHGMAAMDPERQIVVTEVVDLRGARSVPLGPGLSLHLDGDRGRAAAIRDTFNAAVDPGDARAYLRAEAPAHLHLGDGVRFGDLVLVPDEGARVGFGRTESPPAGMHGWDPAHPSMQGIFLMRGPRIEPGRTIPAFESIHVYPFLAEVLDLTPNPNIDGDLSVLGRLIAAPEPGAFS